MLDLGAKFKSVKGFVELAEAGLVGFYSDVGQNLIRWISKAPKVKKESVEKAESDDNGEQFLSSLLELDMTTAVSNQAEIQPVANQHVDNRLSVPGSDKPNE